MKKLLEFYNGLFNPRTKKYRLYIIFMGVLFLLLILIVSKLSQFSIIISIIFGSLILIYNKSTKTIEKISAVLILIFLFQFTLISGHPLVLVFFVMMLLVYLNSYFIKDKNHKIKLEAMIVIALTLIILQVSYPIFKPRVEIISIEDIYQGFIYNENAYGFRYYTLSVLPPLISPSCTNMILGFDVLGTFTEDYTYGININHKENGVTEFCTPLFDFTKRIIRINVVSRQPIDFKISGKNISRFYWISENDNSTHIYETTLFNQENIPMRFRGNVTYYINNNTIFDRNVKLWKYIFNDSSKTHCRLLSFRLTSSRDYKSGDYSGYQIEKDRVKLFFPINEYVLPQNYTNMYVQFDPYNCDNI